MNDPIERYYDQFETRMESAMRRNDAPSRRRVRRIAIAGAVAGLALGVVASALPGSDPEAGTAYAVQQARKALDASAGITHYKLRMRSAVRGHRSRVVFEQELWRTEAGGERWRNRFRTPSGGTVETAYANREIRQYYARRNTYAVTKNAPSGLPVGMLDPLPMLRAALARGVLRDTGLVSIRGRQLRRLEGVDQIGGDGPAPQVTIRLQYLVDAKTFAPVEVTESGGAGELVSTTAIDAYEVLPLNDETRRLLAVEIPSDARRTTSDAIERESTS